MNYEILYQPYKSHGIGITEGQAKSDKEALEYVLKRHLNDSNIPRTLKQMLRHLDTYNGMWCDYIYRIKNLSEDKIVYDSGMVYYSQEGNLNDSVL